MRTPYKVPAGYLTRDLAATFLDVSRSTFLRWAKKHDLRERVEKGVHLYREDDIEMLAAAMGAENV